MNSSTMRGMRRSLVLLVTGTIAATGAAAQQPSRLPTGAVVQPMGGDNGAELRRHLTTLADNPRSIDALIGAGRAALASGDAEAALTFFGRAEQITPRNARVKAGMASAFVQLGRAPAALNLFAESVALGAPVAEIAGDRGLAYDMIGETARAQQDYTMSLRLRPDPEVQRRMALSLAISGERDAALRVIDAQLRRNDRAAWRVQALVLALTGDAAGANRTARGTMPAGAAQAMAPFLTRLAGLNPQQKAMAVHFGHFPATGSRQAAASASSGGAADPGALAFAMGGAPQAARPPAQSAAPATDTRRRPSRSRESTSSARRPTGGSMYDSSDPYGLRGRRSSRPERRAEAPAEPEPEPREVAQLNTRWAGAPVVPAQTPPPQAAVPPTTSRPAPEPASESDRSPSQPSTEGPASSQSASEIAADATSTSAEAAPGFTLVPGRTAGSPQPQAREPLADIASLVETLPQEPPAAPAAPARESRREPAPRAETRPTPPRAAQPAHPRRHWVQVAGGANRAALPREFARLRSQAPELARHAPWTTPLNATNRLLVGPFGSAREAQEFVNRLAERRVAAFAWTSPAGQEIERLQTR